ncbi:hypothetical protein Tco_0494619, partial [Tanacetum coccineum]
MTSLADKSLLSGGDNKPPMLEKHLYDSWKSRMELYMMNRPHGRMILASVEKGPLVWPSITEDRVTRLKEYVELTPAEAIQADCDIKAINIILQGLPTEIYALVSQHRVAKDLWEKIKLLMQGTSLTKQELDQDAPSPSNSHTPQETQTPIISLDVEEDNHDIEVAHMGNDPYFGIPIPEVTSDQSSSSVIIHTIVPPNHHISEHNSKWTKDHPLENIIGALDRPVSTRLQLHEQA